LPDQTLHDSIAQLISGASAPEVGQQRGVR
jgi:hypothetical protein